MAAGSTSAPLIVIEGPPGCGRPVADRLAASGLRVVEGFRVPLGRGAVICLGVVDGAESAAAALLAALDGAGLVIEASADRATIDRLADDLRRLGPVEHRTGTPSTTRAPALDGDARAILALLAEGHSLGEAAELLGLARRTADRRLAAARDALGVERTTEAIARARRLGWFAGGGDR